MANDEKRNNNVGGNDNGENDVMAMRANEISI